MKKKTVLQAVELIGELVGSIVDRPDDANVASTFELQQKLLLIDVQVHSSDVGKLIGKQGRMARSLRTIASAMGVKMGWRIELNLNAPKSEGVR